MATPLIRIARRAATGFALAAALACASREPPSADRPPPPPPDLAGLTVMVLPVQPGRTGAPAGLDAELGYWLAERAPGVKWVFPDALDRVVARSPGLGITPRTLAVAGFGRMALQRIGDPLYGDLRRLGALVDARIALLPVGGGYVPRADGGRIEVAAAIIDTVDGDVLWFGVVGGEPGDEGSTAVVASAARALALTLFP